MLLITGTQRSGTTLIAKALEESGYDLGSSLWDEEVLGGLDSDLICGFFREYLGDPTFPFDDFDVPQVSGGQFAAMAPRVAKFCYLLMNPVFVSVWHKFRPSGDTFLIMNRDKKHVVASKTRMWKRFKHDSLLLLQNYSQLHENFEHSVHCLRELDFRYEILYFPECVSDLGKINAALAALDPTVQINLGAWERIYDPSKIHFK